MDFNLSLITIGTGSWSLLNATYDSTNNKYDVLSGGSVSIRLTGDSIKVPPAAYRLTFDYNDTNVSNLYTPTNRIDIRLTFDDGTCQLFTFAEQRLRYIGINTFEDVVVFTPNPKTITQIDAVYSVGSTLGCSLISLLLQPSVDVNPAVLAVIEQSLPGYVYAFNTTALSVSTLQIQPIYLSIALGDNSSLFGKFSIGGTASADCTLTVNLKIDNTDLPFSPMKQKVFAGDFTIGVPFSILQVHTGGHYLGVYLSASAGTITIPIGYIQVTVEGKNILGGFSAEPPHAELADTLNIVINFSNIIITIIPITDSLYSSFCQNNLDPLNENVSISISSTSISVLNITDNITAIKS